ncbi:MAG: CYTH domain-containing protein [Thermodesulfobacteriota bacterium]
MKLNRPVDHETELTLAICSKEPTVLCDKVATLQEIEGFSLIPGPPLTIHDTYFDTRDRTLRRKSWALRIRIVADTWLITAKGPATVLDSGIISRTEIEREWSRSALDELRALLEKLGVGPFVKSLPFCESDPVRAMLELGLSVIQRRHVIRLPRQVAPKGAKKDAWAEFVIDSVSYDFGSQSVRHFELEIELIKFGMTHELKRLAEALKRLYGDALRPWPHGKLSTGLAIETLLRDSGLRGLVRAGCLLPTAYEKIAANLS